MNIKRGCEQSIIYKHMKRVDILAFYKDIYFYSKYSCKRQEGIATFF